MNDLINRKDLEKIIYDWLSLSKNYHFSTASISLQDLFNIIEHMSSVNQWIPCSKRLPNYNIRVLVINKNNEIDIAELADYSYTDEPDEWWAYEYKLYDVVAWMPLPEPWKGEDE